MKQPKLLDAKENPKQKAKKWLEKDLFILRENLRKKSDQVNDLMEEIAELEALIEELSNA